MKKFLCFVLFTFITVNMFATNSDTYVGSTYYRSIIGGIYQKGDVVGAVFYIDDNNNIMKILSLDPYDIMGEDDWTYTNVVYNLRKYGWNLLNRDVCDEFIANMATIENNETLRHNKNFYQFQLANITMESETNGDYVNIFNIYDSYSRYSKTWRYITIVRNDGSRTVEELGGFNCIGWREVPLEPQYITHFQR